jgi:hypothetical protein
VIKEEIMWDQKTDTGITIADNWSAAKQEEHKNTNPKGMAAYIHGNTGESDAYTDGDSAFAIREALLKG